MSPWNNSLIERYNAVISLTVTKTSNYQLLGLLMLRTHWKMFMASLQTNLFWGKILTSKTYVMIDCLLQKTKHQARQNHIQSESSSKIKLALKKVLAYSDIIYNTGDLVCYKWKGNLNLKETFSVIGRGRQQVLVKHGSRYIRVYPCNLQLSKNSIFGNKDSFPSNIDSSTSS